MQLDILSLEWPNSERDLNIVTPVLIYLNRHYGLRYATKSIFNGYYYLIKFNPKLLIISNFQGAEINHDIVKLAYQMGIKVITLISEGSVNDEEAEQFLWGWNQDKILYIDKMLLWSKHSKNIFLKKHPDIHDKLVVTGGTGFDRYSLLHFKDKEDFFEKNQIINYKKIIGIAAWGFNILYGEYYQLHKDYFEKTFGIEQIDMHRKDLIELQKIYKNLIENNQDILFILREHPRNNEDFSKSEFYGLEKFENVFISNHQNESRYKIHDLINISDLWIGYTTTTALEAWLLNKQTFLINPTRSDFIREETHKGSPIVANEKEAQILINEYFTHMSIYSFEQLHAERSKIIKSIIEYNDGNNYKRASAEIFKTYISPEKKRVLKIIIYIKAFKQILKIILSKTVYKKRWPELNYKSNFADHYYKMYDQAICD